MNCTWDLILLVLCTVALLDLNQEMSNGCLTVVNMVGFCQRHEIPRDLQTMEDDLGHTDVHRVTLWLNSQISFPLVCFCVFYTAVL
jgi:hypothetical protein